MPAAWTVSSTSSASARRADARRERASVTAGCAPSACTVRCSSVARSVGDCGRTLFHTALRPAPWTRPPAALSSVFPSLVLQHAPTSTADAGLSHEWLV